MLRSGSAVHTCSEAKPGKTAATVDMFFGISGYGSRPTCGGGKEVGCGTGPPICGERVKGADRGRPILADGEEDLLGELERLGEDERDTNEWLVVLVGSAVVNTIGMPAALHGPAGYGNRRKFGGGKPMLI